MSHRPSRLVPSLFVMVLVVVALLPTNAPAPFGVSTAHAASSALAYFWSAPEINDTSSVAWGDVNGDGTLDLVVGNLGSPNQIYTNQGGTLVLDDALWSPTPSDAQPTTSVAWGDVNGDGALDLLVGNNGAANQLYRNQGGVLVLDTSWKPAKQFTTSVAWGDVNGDGALDLVVGNSGAANQLYRNEGGTLILVDTWNPDPDTTTSVAWGDVNGDGALDLVVGNKNAPNQLYLNQGGTLVLDPTLWSSAPPAPQPTTSVAWGDVNGDGALDLVVGNSGAVNQIYTNQGGTLVLDDALWSTLPVRVAHDTTSVAWGDANGDGALDLVVGNGDAPNQLYRNKGGTLVLDASWKPAKQFTTSVAWGDVNGDGTLDLAIGNNFGSANQIYRNQSGAPVLDTTWVPALQPTASLAWGDVNGDGALDLVVGNNGAPNQLYRNEGGTLVLDNALWSPTPPITNTTSSVAWGDVNGDGALDLLVGNSDAPNQLYRNQGGTLVLDTSWVPAAQPTMSVAWGDVNGDGLLDLVVGNDDKPNQLYRNEGGTLKLDTTWNPAKQFTRSVAWGDVNGDGALDLVVGNYAYDSNQLYRNEGGTLVLDPTWTPTPEWTRSLALGDVDGDGDLDLVTGNDVVPNHLYRNDGGTLVLDTAWNPEAQATSSVALGDVDGDGALDLVVGNDAAANQLYRNQDGALVLDSAWTPAAQPTTSVAWGDVNGDGALDLVVGNQDAPLQLYRNGASNVVASPQTLAVGRPATVASTGTASADFYAAARVLATRQIAIPFTLTDATGTLAREIRAQYSLNGGGSWKPALAATGTPTTNFATLPERFPVRPSVPLDIPDAGQRTSVVAVAAPANGTVGTVTDVEVELTLTHPAVGDLIVTLTAPDGTAVELFAGLSGANVTGAILDDQAATAISAGTAPFSGRFRPTGTLADFNGKNPLGTWTLSVSDAVASNIGTLDAWALRLKTTGVQHTFQWDTFASGVFGQSDNAVVRLIAPAALTTGPNATPLFQRPAVTGTSLPFRVRGAQVRVVDPQNVPQANAIVFRLNDTLPRDQQLFAPSASAPGYTTAANGYLGGRGELTFGDQLIALAPVPLSGAYANVYSQTVRLYATNLITSGNGVGGTPVTTSGVQTVTVSLAHPLALFDLTVSLEWDARYDTRFMAQLEGDLARASELLFQASQGQAALGQITIFHDRENWDDANIRIYASNRVRPSALIGGVAGLELADPASAQVVYGPGQVRMGAIWNRFGSATGNLSEDWPRTLVHELGHYLFFLEDNYLGLRAGQIIPVSTCPGLMSDTYAATWQYQTSAGWNPGCAQTFSQQTTGRADWTTIQTFYPALVAPTLPLSTLPAGPIRLPFLTTEITSVDPLTTTARLDVPIFYTVDSAGGRVLPALTARAYLFQHSHGEPSSDYTQLTPLGRATNDQVLARGARDGDRLCLFEPTVARFGCATIQAGNEKLTLNTQPAWRPDIQLTPVTSVTLEVSVTGVPAGAPGLRAALYPLDDDPLPTPITLTADGSGGYRGTFALAYPLQGAYLHLQTTDAPTPTWEAVTSFALSGNAGGFARTGGGFARTGGGFARTGGGFARTGGGFARTGGGFARTGGGFARTGGGFARTGGGFARTGGAPVSSAEGDVLLIGDNLSFGLGQFLLLQTTSSLPPVPTWATLIGQGYRFTTSPSTPNLTGSALSFSYLDSEVPTGEENGIQVYYRSPTATAWQAITTTLDTYFNLASIPTQGPGLYAVMSSVHVSLSALGWNNFAYPVASSREVGLALASINGAYRIVYSHVPTETLDPWKVYAPAPTPGWVNDLTALNFGQGYWIYATQATNLLLNGSVAPASAAFTSALSLPPAVIYGVLTTTGGVAPTVGQSVEARIGATVCGRGVTRQVGDQIGVVLKVAALGPDAPACGTPGSVVTVTVAGRAVGQTWWDNTRAVNLAATVRVYLPLLAR